MKIDFEKINKIYGKDSRSMQEIQYRDNRLCIYEKCRGNRRDN